MVFDESLLPLFDIILMIYQTKKTATDAAKQTLKWNPQGKWKARRSWSKSKEEERKMTKVIWNTAEVAPNRVRWWSVVDALCSTRRRKH